MKNFNFYRYSALLNYDWQQNKRGLGMMYLIITLVYIVITTIVFLFRYGIMYDEPISDSFSKGMLVYSYVFFDYAQIVIILFITTILHRKFTNTQSAISYLSLPASSFEKCATMITDYAIGYVGLYFVYILFFFVTAFTGLICSPELDWFQTAPWNTENSILDFATTGMNQTLNIKGSTPEQTLALTQIAEEGMNTFLLYIKMGSVLSLIIFVYYLILNMCFKNNGQIKSIALLYGTEIVLCILAGIFLIVYMTIVFNSPNFNLDKSTNVETIKLFMPLIYIVKTILYCFPLILLGEIYLFYHQIKNKQAK